MKYSEEELRLIEDTEIRLKVIPMEWIEEFARDCTNKEIHLPGLDDELVVLLWNAFIDERGYDGGQL